MRAVGLCFHVQLLTLQRISLAKSCRVAELKPTSVSVGRRNFLPTAKLAVKLLIRNDADDDDVVVVAAAAVAVSQNGTAPDGLRQQWRQMDENPSFIL